VAELEKILTQIANLEENEDAEAVEFIRGRVDRHDLLLKIDLEQLKHETSGASDGSGTDGEQTGADKGSI
jgi:hypothetical protein